MNTNPGKIRRAEKGLTPPPNFFAARGSFQSPSVATQHTPIAHLMQ